MKKLSAAFLFSFLALLLAGCDMSANPDNNRKTVITAQGEDCPDITGTYEIMDQAGYTILGGHYEKDPKVWAIMSIAGNPQQELQITLYEAHTGISFSEPIRRTRNKDYYCKDGWLQTPSPNIAAEVDPADASAIDGDLFEKSLSFAKNKMGELVIRTNIRHWKGISVWCGDGCKYLPIPFTSRTFYKWSQWPSSAIPVPISNTDAADPDKFAPDDETPEGMVARRLKKLTPLGVQLGKVLGIQNHWRTTFRGNSNALMALHETLQTTADIEFIDVKINTLAPQRKELQLDFRLPPTKAEREAKQATEEQVRLLARQEEAKDRAIVKRLLPCFPKGMTLTFYNRDKNGFLAEVRHKDDDAFYQLIVNVMASGEFLQADIKTRKYVDNEGLQVVDVLLIPKPDEQPRP